MRWSSQHGIRSHCWMLIIMLALLSFESSSGDHLMLDMKLVDLQSCTVKGDVDSDVKIHLDSSSCGPNFVDSPMYYVHNFTVEPVCGLYANKTIPRQRLNITWHLRKIQATKDVYFGENFTESIANGSIDHSDQRAEIALDVSGRGTFQTMRICIVISVKMHDLTSNHSLIFGHDCLLLKDESYAVYLIAQNQNLPHETFKSISLSTKQCRLVRHNNSNDSSLPAAPTQPPRPTERSSVILVAIVVSSIVMAILVAIIACKLNMQQKRLSSSLGGERLSEGRGRVNSSRNSATQEGEPMLIPPDLSYLQLQYNEQITVHAS